MPEKKSKGPNKPGANLPAPLKIPFQIHWSANPDSQIREKCSERLVKLLKHYGIKDSDPNKWLLLSWHLADELGLFRFAKKRGRHLSWDIENLAKLVEDVDKIKKANRKLSTTGALNKLSKDYSKNYRNIAAKTLENRHSVAKKRHAPLIHALVGAEMLAGTEIKRPNSTDASPTPQKPVQKDGQPEKRDIRPTFGLAELGRPKIHPEN
jgi:hypothetical protein